MGVRTDPDTRPEHGTSEVRRVVFDFTKDLLTGESISTYVSTTFTPTTPLVVDGTPSFSGALLNVLVKDGNAGETYQLVAKVTTSSGQTLESGGTVYVDDA